jgi:proteasome lid subunit RPN8/RPN11
MGGSIHNPMKASASGILLTCDHWAHMEADVAARTPEEACGFVVGEGNRSRLVIPVTNILHNASRFRMDPEEQLKAFLQVEEKGWDILAVYHSHPNGISSPSVTDYEELTFPGIIYLIWYQEANLWQCRGYLMRYPVGTDEVPVIISTNE